MRMYLNIHLNVNVHLKHKILLFMYTCKRDIPIFSLILSFIEVGILLSMEKCTLHRNVLFTAELS